MCLSQAGRNVLLLSRTVLKVAPCRCLMTAVAESPHPPPCGSFQIVLAPPCEDVVTEPQEAPSELQG